MLSKFPVVIAAAGIGRRMNSDIPKQYLRILNKTVIEHTVSRLQQHPQISDIIIVLHPNDQFFETLPIAHANNVHTVVGGNERVDSVLAGLNWLQTHSKKDEWVLVHDAARPCVPHTDLSALISLAASSNAEGESGGILATKVRDTMKRGEKHILRTESREHLWHALTPQFFRLKQLIAGIQRAQLDNAIITDEASAMEHCCYSVALIEGSGENIKITTPDDLKLAEFYLSNSTHKDI